MWKYIFIILCFTNINFSLNAQNSTNNNLNVSGQVLDSKGLPIIGANVIIKNINRLGTVTDIDGKFELKKVSPYDILVFSFLGFKSQEVPIDKRNIINITLIEDSEILDEVVVVGYGSQKKSSIVGAIVTLEPNKLKVPASSVSQALGGRISGIISTQRSGEPGADNANFTIRGLSTFGSGGGPLILVDGVEGRSINDIDVEDIESFSVLKDAAAGAVYGVRGANGVVMITTRKGKEGKINISARFDIGITKPTRLPKYIDSYNYVKLKNYALIGREQPAEYSDLTLEKFKYGLDPDLNPNVDWLNELTNPTATNKKAQINISGGNSTARYYVSLGYYNESGFFKNFGGNGYKTNIDYDKYNFRSNVDINVTPSTILELGVAGILYNRERPYAGVNDILSYAMTMNPTKFPMVYSNGKIPRMDDILNPYLLLSERGYTKELYNRIESNLILRQDLSSLTKGLKAAFKYSFDIENSYHGNYLRNVNTWIANGRDASGNLILTPKDQGNTGALSYEKKDDAGERVTYLEASLNYDRLFAKKHNIAALLLYNQRELISYAADNLRKSLPYRSQGLAGRLSYSYDGRYFAEFNCGYNGSENFVKGRRFGFFPSYAAGWIVSNEKWFEKTSKVISLLKIKGSYGLVGNDKVGAERFPFYTSVSGGNGGYSFGVDGQSSFGGNSEGLVGSPNLTWEKSLKSNIGLELGLFNKLSLNVDLFLEKRTDIFVKRNSLSSVIGIHPDYLPSANLGEMHNKGVDISLDYKEKIGKLELGLYGNFTFNRNKVISTEQPPALYSYQERQGRKLYGTIDMSKYDGMGYLALGLFKTQDEIDNSPRQSMASSLKPGDIKYKDVNGDGVVDNYDRVFMQDKTPEIMYGFGLSALYHGFDLSVFFQGAANCNIFLPEDINPFYYANERGNILQDVADNIFIPKEISGNPLSENYNAKYPRMSLSNNRNNTVSSSYWLRSTAFLRLKNAEIGYTLPKQLTRKISFPSMRIYFSGSNLALFDALKLWDPEVKEYSSYPLNTVYTLGIKLDF